MEEAPSQGDPMRLNKLVLGHSPHGSVKVNAPLELRWAVMAAKSAGYPAFVCPVLACHVIVET